MGNRVEDPENLKDILDDPQHAEVIAWAESAPKRCLIITDVDFRWEGFNSTLEFVEWLRMVVPDKSEILASAQDEAAQQWEKQFGRKIPPHRRK